VPRLRGSLSLAVRLLAAGVRARRRLPPLIQEQGVAPGAASPLLAQILLIPVLVLVAVLAEDQIGRGIGVRHRGRGRARRCGRAAGVAVVSEGTPGGSEESWGARLNYYPRLPTFAALARVLSVSMDVLWYGGGGRVAVIMLLAWRW